MTEQVNRTDSSVVELCSSASPPPLSSASDLTQATPPELTPPTEAPVCAKNISLTASGEKVILWTRDADRVILTRCQQDGATPTTFTHISNILGNKTPTQVCQRFQDLMRLFHTRTRLSSDEDGAGPRPGLGLDQDQNKDQNQD